MFRKLASFLLAGSLLWPAAPALAGGHGCMAIHIANQLESKIAEKDLDKVVETAVEGIQQMQRVLDMWAANGGENAHLRPHARQIIAELSKIAVMDANGQVKVKVKNVEMAELILKSIKKAVTGFVAADIEGPLAEPNSGLNENGTSSVTGERSVRRESLKLGNRETQDRNTHR